LRKSCVCNTYEGDSEVLHLKDLTINKTAETELRSFVQCRG